MTVYARKQAWCDWHKTQERPSQRFNRCVRFNERYRRPLYRERRAGVRESTRRGTRCVSATVDERV